jgi:glycosyltransferase involved in cell wall biosynthesis
VAEARVSVIIPTYNKAPYLARTLASWLHQRSREYEIVLVDDGSTDNTGEVIAAYESRLPIRARKIANSGRAAARNRALEMARGEVIVFSDDDRIVAPGFVDAHVAALGDTEDVIVGWQLGVISELRPDLSEPTSYLHRLAQTKPEWDEVLKSSSTADTFTDTEIARDLGVIEPLIVPESWFENFVMHAVNAYGDDITPCTLAWIFGTTGNLCVRRSTLDRVGPFDEVFRTWGLEDAELHYRFTKDGSRTRVAREALNYHQNHPRKQDSLMKSWRGNAGAFLEKHPTIEVAAYVAMTYGFFGGIEEVDAVLRGLEKEAETPLARFSRRAIMGIASAILQKPGFLIQD